MVAAFNQNTESQTGHSWVRWLVLVLVGIAIFVVIFLLLAPKPLVVKGTLKTAEGPVAIGAYDFRLKFYDVTTRTDLVYSYDAMDIQVDGNGGFDVELPADALTVATLMQVCVASPDNSSLGEATIPSCEAPNKTDEVAFDQTVCGLTTVDQDPTSPVNWLATRNVVYTMPSKACGGTGGEVASISSRDVVTPLLEEPGTLGELLGGVKLQPGTILAVGDGGQLETIAPKTLREEIIQEETASQSDTTESDGGAGSTSPSGSSTTTVHGEANTDNQTLSLSGNVLSISGGNSVVLPNASGSDGDTVIGNEITDVIANSGLVRVGSGTVLDPYKVGIQTCATGEILKSNNGDWECTPDTGGASYMAGSGLQLAGTTFSVNSPTCSGTTKLQWDGAVFVCATDVDTTYTAGTGLTLVGTTFNNSGVLGVAGAGPLTSTGGQNPTISFMNGTTAGQVWQWNGSAWALATLSADGDSMIGNEVTNVTGGNSGLVRAGSGTGGDPYTLAANTGNGLQVVSNQITVNSPTCAGADKLQWNGTAFVCATDQDTTYSAITNGGLRLVGTQFGLVACTSGQLLKATATAGEYACAADNDTTYSAGSGLSLVGTTFNNTGVLNVTGSGPITSSGGQTPDISFANGSVAGQFWQWNGSAWVLATLPTDGDSVIGNEVTGVTGVNSGLVRSGSGTSIDPYTLAVSVGNGLQLVGGNVAVNSPTCAGTTKLQWNGTAFVCSADVDTTDFTITDGTTSQAVNAAEAITFVGDSNSKTTVTLSGTRQLTFGLDTTGATNGQTLTFNGSGIAWQTPAASAPVNCSAGGTYFCQDGNTFGTTATLGTNDVQTLNFETNNTVQMTILANGNVGIGTSPTEKLDVNGNINIPVTSTTAGVIKQNGDRMIHTAGDSLSFYAGVNSGNLTNTGFDNVGIGPNALEGITSGFYNTALGSAALKANTDGIYNTAVGAYSMELNTEGFYNSALGERTLSSNTTGDNNTAVGGDALLSNTIGGNNTGLGVNALGSNTTGAGNVAVGFHAGITSLLGNDNTTGSSNTFLGNLSGLGSSTQPNNSTAVGAFSVVNQSDSLVLGCIVGVNTCPASTNVGIGTATPAKTLHLDRAATENHLQITNDATGHTGTDGLVVGLDAAGAGFFLNLDNKTMYMGTNAGTQLVIAAPSGNVGIHNTNPGFRLHVGSSSIASGTAVARFENAGGTCTVTPNSGSISCTSDIRAKKNIDDFDGALDIVNQIDIKSYNMKADPDDATKQIGVIAQEVEEVLPSLVTTDADGMKSFAYAGLAPVLLQAIKEQQVQMDDIQSGIWSGGVVTKDTTFKKSVVFDGSVQFGQNTTFEENVEVLGKIKLSGDQVNSATLSKGERRVTVKFKGSYKDPPYITVTPREFTRGDYRVTDVKKTGFVIEVSETQPKSVRFDWHAFSR